MWRELCRNALAFVLGFIAVIFPFAVYFGYYECFNEFIFATFTYNVAYAKNIVSWMSEMSAGNLKKFFRMFMLCLCILPAAALSGIRGKRWLSGFCLITGVLQLYVFCTGRLYSQYAGVCLAQLAIYLNEVYHMKVYTKDRGISQSIVICATVLICGTVFESSFFYFGDAYKKYHTDSGQEWDRLVEIIPENERDSVVAYGENMFKGFYLREDIVPCYKYQFLQEWHGRFDECVREDIHHVFENGDAKWIVASGKMGIIQDVLENRYTEVARTDKCILYRLN